MSSPHIPTAPPAPPDLRPVREPVALRIGLYLAIAVAVFAAFGVLLAGAYFVGYDIPGLSH